MKNNRRGETIFVAVLILGLLGFVIGSFSYTIQLRLMPFLSGLSGIALLLIVLSGKYIPAARRRIGQAAEGQRAKLPIEGEEGIADDEGRLGDGLKVISYIVVLWGAVLVVGLPLSMFTFIIIFLRFEARVRLVKALVGSGIAVALMILGLKILGIDMWAGIMPTVVPGYVGGSLMPPL